jgi:general secretion pathway protein K
MSGVGIGTATRSASSGSVLNARAVSRGGQRGVALAVVVWFVAAMSLLVTGIVSEARIDTRLAQLHYTKAQVASAGDGAIRLALATETGRRANGEAGLARRQYYQLGPNAVEVRMIPSGSLVNVSAASRKTLRAMFARAAASGNQAESGARITPGQLAGAVVAYREGGRGGRSFYDLEDLMRAKGVDRTVFESVRDYISVGALSGGGDNMTTDERLSRLEAAMYGEGEMLVGDTEQNHNTFRMDAVISLGDRTWLRRLWVRLGGGDQEGLPWQIIRREGVRLLPSGIGD